MKTKTGTKRKTVLHADSTSEGKAALRAAYLREHPMGTPVHTVIGPSKRAVSILDYTIQQVSTIDTRHSTGSIASTLNEVILQLEALKRIVLAQKKVKK